MHFFLNKSGWSAKYGWTKSFEATMQDIMANLTKSRLYINRYGMSPERFAQIVTGKTKWPANMGATTRLAIYPNGLPHNPNS